ncbi:MAG: immunoglobulin domain-containing protein [Chthoniobacteraceae bacterium]
MVLVLLAGAGLVRAASEPRTMLPDSIRLPDPHRVMSVQPLRKEHLGREMEFQIALRMRDYPNLLKRMETGERIPHDEMEARYLPLPANYQAVIEWAKGQGLAIVGTDSSRLAVFVKGTVGQIQTATQAQFAEVTVADGTYTSAVTAPSIPATLEAAVLGINGLQPHIHLHHVQSAQPLIANVPPYLVSEIMSAYGASNLGYNGAGETIAILIDTFPRSSDLTAFWARNGISQSLANIQEIQAVQGTPDSLSGEETLDTEWTSGIASGANIRIYASAQLSFTDLDEGLERILSDLPNTPSMHELSISLGIGETEVSASQKMTDSQYFASITNYGVSIFVASGDDGAYMGGVLQPSYYASDPNVTGVGGTSLTLESSGTVEAETAWDDSGGGVSSYFSRPAWQTGQGVPAGTTRCVPDVASVANPNTGAYIYFEGSEEQIGGTSWGAPTWAGLCALINEARIQNGLGPLGLLNPRIYPLIGTSSFQDITSGNNSAYSAGVGYDLVTGIGRPIMSALLPALSGGGNTIPEVTSFTPTVGPAGTSVAITGINLDLVTGVEFSGSAAAYSINSDNSISTTVPPGAVTGPITLLSATTSSVTTANFTVAPLPTNDEFADATIIGGTQGQVLSSNLGATREAGEPEIGGNPGGSSVWWEWQAPANGTYTLSTAGSSFDTLLGIFTGSAVDALTTVATGSDYGTSVNSSVTFNASAGTTYYIDIDGNDGVQGAITLTWEEDAAAPEIAGFNPQSGMPGSVVTVTGSNFLGTTAVTLGGTAAGFNVLSDTETTLTVPAAAMSGPITMTSPEGTGTSGSDYTVIPLVPNDNFASATVITGESGVVTGNNEGATKEPGEPDIAGNSGGKSIWYLWTPLTTGPVTFTTYGSTFDTLLGVFTGSSVTTLTPVMENDDYGNTTTSSVTFDAYAGTYYHIAVDGYNGASGSVVLNWAVNDSLPAITGFSPATGSIDTTVQITGSNFTGATSVTLDGTPLSYTILSDSHIAAVVAPGAMTGVISVGNLLGAVNSATEFTVLSTPANDDFANSTPLAGATVHVTGANVGATREPGEPEIEGNPGGASVWWNWTPPVTGVYAVSTLGSNFDTLLAVFTGIAVNDLSLVAQNDDDPAGGVTSYLTFTATQGTIYQIDVDGVSGAQGAIDLSIYPQEPSTDLYSTGFEAKDGFVNGDPLAGQPFDAPGTKWVSEGSGGNGIVSGYAGMTGQQAYVGYSPPTVAGADGVDLYYPVDYSPVGTNEPIITFSVTMAIDDSTNSNYDNFEWRLYNKERHNFFTLDFNNSNLQVYYYQDGSSTPVPTHVQFENNTAMTLMVTMDYGHNKWSAILNGSPLVSGKPISTSSNPLDFGSMDAVWQLADPGEPGNNYMVFDNYSLVAGQSPAVKITAQPQSQTVIAGDPVTLSVGAVGEAPLYYQWMLNNRPLAGEDSSSLIIPDADPLVAGNYTVSVSNAIGLVMSSRAKLTVTPEPVAPEVTLEPGSVTVAAGSSPVLQAVATGYPAPALQWMFQGNPIEGAVKKTLTLAKVQAASSGTYTVLASNPLGTGTSNAATISLGNSFPSQQGNFSGLIYNGLGVGSGNGLFKITLGSGGAFTGTVTLSGVTYRMAGAFNPEGEWQGTVGRAMGGLPVVVTLQLSLSGANEITGSVVIGDTQETGAAVRNTYSKNITVAPERPAYTLTLTGTTNGLPQGIGYAAITVDQTGNVRATGRLGDYTPFSFSSVVSDAGTWPFYVSLYDSTGYISGALTFEELTQTDLDGVLFWLRPAVNQIGGYSAGFQGEVTAAGYVYTPPAKDAPAIPLDAQHQGTLTFSGDLLSNPAAAQLSLGSTGGLLVSGTSGIKLSLSPETGVFSGTVNLGYRKLTPFEGVLIQKLDEGSGLFQSPTVSGQAGITSP